MIIDRSHASWGFATALLTAAGGAAWVWSRTLPGGAGGGTPVGLALGVAALATMLFALALGARRALLRRFALLGRGFVPRLGSMDFWMRGHLWLGFVGLPLALLHAGFRASGSLGIALLALAVLTVLTGIYGLVVQTIVPHELATRERGQTTHEEGPRRSWNLVSDGHAAVKKITDDALKLAREAQVAFRTASQARLEKAASQPEAEKTKLKAQEDEKEIAHKKAISDAQDVRTRLEKTRERLDAARPDLAVKKPAAPVPAPLKGKLSRASVGTRLAEVPKGPLPPETDPAALVAPSELVAFYDEIALPFLLAPLEESLLQDELGSEIVFEGVRQRIPEAHRAALAELRSCCDAVRRKARLHVLYRVLHGWLLVHVPLAVLLVALAVVHAFMATRF